MIQRFWRAVAGLGILVTLYTSLSWYYLYTTHTTLLVPTSRAQLLSLSTGLPSIWDFVHPTADGWTLPFVLLIVQVFLTGGFYGTLVRANTGQNLGGGSFVSDAMRSFWRLFFWNLLWAAVAVLVAGVSRAMPAFGILFAVIVVLARFLFLFGDIALVSEPDVRVALKSAVGALLNGLVAMIPFALAMMLLGGVAMALAGTAVTAVDWLIAVVYGLVITWVLHMVVARYLYYSQWQDRHRVAATV